VRASLEAYGPAGYVGVDISPGPSVDVVEDATRLLDRFEPESFDVVLSTEMVEHVRDWRAVFTNMKRLCVPGGVVVITTRSPGFPYHAYPNDFWRYEPSDMSLIFADFEIEMLESEDNSELPGVFVKARRTESERSIDLSPIALTSILTDDRRVTLTDLDVGRFMVTRRLNLAVRPFTRFVPQGVKAPFKKRLRLGPGIRT